MRRLLASLCLAAATAAVAAPSQAQSQPGPEPGPEQVLVRVPSLDSPGGVAVAAARHSHAIHRLMSASPAGEDAAAPC